MVPNLLIPLLLVWGVIVIVMVLGVENGIGRLNRVFVPVLVILFACLVIRALFLPGATEGLNVFFTPKMGVSSTSSSVDCRLRPDFSSLNVGFAVMITYSSYLKRKTNLVGTGYMVAFANSSFEALAGIGVFATLGFLAVSSGQQVGDVAEGGISLAFIAFPTIISHMPGGTVFGVVFFGCLAIAGLTSQISVVEVCIAAIRDKFGLARWAAATAVILPLPHRLDPPLPYLHGFQHSRHLRQVRVLHRYCQCRHCRHDDDQLGAPSPPHPADTPQRPLFTSRRVAMALLRFTPPPPFYSSFWLLKCTPSSRRATGTTPSGHYSPSVGCPFCASSSSPSSCHLYRGQLPLTWTKGRFAGPKRTVYSGATVKLTAEKCCHPGPPSIR
ncbi:MAG: hypothetical protein U1U88_000521 [Lawsonella clevelandensis]